MDIRQKPTLRIRAFHSAFQVFALAVALFVSIGVETWLRFHRSTVAAATADLVFFALGIAAYRLLRPPRRPSWVALATIAISCLSFWIDVPTPRSWGLGGVLSLFWVTLLVTGDLLLVRIREWPDGSSYSRRRQYVALAVALAFAAIVTNIADDAGSFALCAGLGLALICAATLALRLVPFARLPVLALILLAMTGSGIMSLPHASLSDAERARQPDGELSREENLDLASQFIMFVPSVVFFTRYYRAREENDAIDEPEVAS